MAMYKVRKIRMIIYEYIKGTKCIAIVRTNHYTIDSIVNNKIFERGVALWQLNQLICM